MSKYLFPVCTVELREQEKEKGKEGEKERGRKRNDRRERKRNDRRERMREREREEEIERESGREMGGRGRDRETEVIQLALMSIQNHMHTHRG